MVTSESFRASSISIFYCETWPQSWGKGIVRETNVIATFNCFCGCFDRFYCAASTFDDDIESRFSPLNITLLSKNGNGFGECFLFTHLHLPSTCRFDLLCTNYTFMWRFREWGGLTITCDNLSSSSFILSVQTCKLKKYKNPITHSKSRVCQPWSFPLLRSFFLWSRRWLTSG